MLISYSGIPAKTADMEKLNLSKIVQLDFPADQYIKEVTSKSQVSFHHTVSGEGIRGDFRHWVKSPERIATCTIIGHDGQIHQLFSSSYWAYHLGVKKKVFKDHDLAYQNLNKIAIGVELDRWGGLKYIDQEWRCAPNNFGRGSRVDRHGDPVKVVIQDESNIQFYPDGYRGYEGFEKYTNKQLQKASLLLKYWNGRHGIPLDYKPDMWDVSIAALSGEPGVWTHTSYRKDKSDCHPQPELIQMLKGLT